MSSVKRKISGVIVPVVTPIDGNERVDEKAFRAVIRRCINSGVRGIFVGGSAGMGPMFTDTEWKRAMEIARDEVRHECSLMAGVICTSTACALERIRFLEQIHYETMVVTPTYYITLSRDEDFKTHFEECRQASDMEMIIYNIPSCTYSQIPLGVVEDMADRNWFSAIKESSGNRQYFKQMALIAERHNITLLQGNEPDIEWGLKLGASGIVPVCANFEPKTFVQACAAAAEADYIRLKELQGRIDYLRENLLVQSELWISGIMYGLKTLGIGSGIPLKPLPQVSEKTKQRIDSLSRISDKVGIAAGVE
jgi:4-hydroxy-tetrahydrodipicolinate synthase